MNSYKTNKILRVTLFTSLVLGSIGLTLYPDTNSRFIKNSDTETVLKFNSSINNLYGGSTELTHEPTSTGENLYLKLTFNRNEILRPETTSEKPDKYYIEVPEYCTVYNNDVDSTLGSTELTLTNDMKRDINVEIDCVPESIANKNSGNVTVPIKVYEKFSNEEKFIYWKFDYFGGTLEEYYDKVGYDPNPPVGEDPVLPPGYTRIEKETFKDVYTRFSTVINEIVAQVGDEYLPITLDYLYPLDLTSESHFLSSLEKIDEINSKQGFSIKFYPSTEDRNKYILDYKIDSNLVGYAKTDNYNFSGTKFFTSQKEDDLRNALKYYLQRYYKDSATEELVYNYILDRSNNDFKSFIYGTKLMPGIKRVEDAISNFQINNYTLPVVKNSLTPNIIKIDWQEPKNAAGMWMIYAYSLEFSDLIEKNNILAHQDATHHTQLLNSVIKNSLSSTKVAYTEYFICSDNVYDTDGTTINKKKYLIIKVSSNPDDGEYTLATLDSIESDLDLTFSNNASKNTLDIKVVYNENSNETDEIKTKLETYFGLTLDDSNSTITTDEATKTVTISIKKDKILEAANNAQDTEADSETTESQTDEDLDNKKLPETEIINNMQVKFLSTEPIENALNNNLRDVKLNTEEVSCPPISGMQVPCLEPVTDGKNDSKEEEIIEEPGIMA